MSASLYTATALSEVQAAWKPGIRSDGLTPPEQNSAIQKICRQLVEEFGFLPKVTGHHRGDLLSELQTRLGERYQVGDEVGAGRLSIVYKATQKNPNREVAVKLFVASEFDDGRRGRFGRLSRKVRNCAALPSSGSSNTRWSFPSSSSPSSSRVKR